MSVERQPLPLVGPPQTVEAPRPGPAWRTYARGLRVARHRLQGDLGGASGLPDLTVERRDAPIPPAQASRYAAVCGAGYDGRTLPPAFAEVLFHDLLAGLFLHPDFPLSPFGMIHVQQDIAVRGPLRAHERPDLRCRVVEAARTARGIALSVGLEARVGDTLRWSGTAGFLSRSPEVRGGSRSRRDGQAVSGPRIEASADVGRRYARASGDWNPHHLWPVTARALGYRRPIAHGMWSLARVLASVEAALPKRLDTLDIACRFKRPLFLPGAPVLERTGDALAGLSLTLRDPETGAPHLEASVQATGLA